MKIVIGRITNAWILALETQEELIEYAYADKRELVKHVQRLIESTETVEQQKTAL